MPETLLDLLDQWKTRFGAGRTADLEKLLSAVHKLRVTDAASLIRLHETLLFLRAYPRSAKVARMADAILFSFADRVTEARAAGSDLSELTTPELCGIAGTSFSAAFSYEVVRRLVELHPRALRIDWESLESPGLGAVLSRFIPLLAEDWPVEAHVPYQDWLRGTDLRWLMKQFERLPITPRDRAGMFDSMQLPIEWDPANSRSTRSRMRLAGGKLFLHAAPLLRRADVSLSSELQSPPVPLTRLNTAAARRILDMILDTSVMRYRELYGFTYPDARSVLRADLGRGVQLFFFGLPPEWRLPLRAYHSALFFKNGVPIGYVEVLSLFERAEVGFNLYYTFREGESAWLYARVLRLFRQILGVRCFSVDPYQIGHHNHEAIDSGAFWFYRKLGFRPVTPEIARLAEREEARIREQPGYRTSVHTLKKLAEGYMIFEGPGSQPGAWDRFRIRNFGFAAGQRQGPSGLEIALSLIPNLDQWTRAEKRAVADIVRAKQSGPESRYLRLMQRHPKFRSAFQRLGSRGVG